MIHVTLTVRQVGRLVAALRSNCRNYLSIAENAAASFALQPTEQCLGNIHQLWCFLFILHRRSSTIIISFVRVRDIGKPFGLVAALR
jgi:hypothetical protein